MTFKQLEYFITIADLQNITAASKILNIAQPALSYQLKTLEDELGVNLFIRSGRNLEITQDGMILHSKGVEILSLLNSTIEDIQNSGKDIHHTINIGTVTSVSNRILPKKIIDFRKTNPNVDYQIWEGNSIRIMEMLDKGIVEIGLIREPFDSSRYNSKTINDEALGADHSDFFVAMGQESFFGSCKGESITMISLKDTPLIIHRRFETILVNACRQKGFFPEIICRNDDITSSISWAESGIGVAIVPYTSSKVAVSNDLIVKKITEPSIDSKVLLVWRKDTQISNTTAEFIKIL